MVLLVKGCKVKESGFNCFRCGVRDGGQGAALAEPVPGPEPVKEVRPESWVSETRAGFGFQVGFIETGARVAGFGVVLGGLHGVLLLVLVLGGVLNGRVKGAFRPGPQGMR